MNKREIERNREKKREKGRNIEKKREKERKGDGNREKERKRCPWSLTTGQSLSICIQFAKRKTKYIGRNA